MQRQQSSDCKSQGATSEEGAAISPGRVQVNSAVEDVFPMDNELVGSCKSLP